VKNPSQVFGNDPDSRFIVTNSDGVNSVNGVSNVPKEWAIAPPQAELTTEELLETALADTTESENDEAVSISVENPQAATQENPRIAMYAAGIAVLFLLFSSTGNAAALLEEAESGTLDRILVSQAGLFHIVTGKWLGILLLGCLQITVMFVWAELVFRIQLAKHIVGFCIMTFSTAAATASFAMLLATLCKSRAQLNAVSVVIILSMSAVGGSMIPRFAMSDRMKEIGRWTFNAWALDGYQKIFWFQSPLTSLQNEVAVLLGSSLVLGVLTLLFSGRWKRG
jgi:ABC-2 type transport system permease protein